MPSHSERQVLPYTTQQLFDLVIDIERYPDFLPWCRAARILERKEGELLGELVIAFHHLSESYTSRVTYKRPESPDSPGSIDVVMVKGPFDYLTNRWRFNPLESAADTGFDKKSMSEVDFFLDFKFRSRILDRMIGGLFGKATAKMVSAFKQRAHSMYG